MEVLQSAFSIPLHFIARDCLLPIGLQGLSITYPVLLASLTIRLCVLWLPIQALFYDLLSLVLGFWVLWWYYESSLSYFIILLFLVYFLLYYLPVGRRGIVVASACLIFVLMCELLVMSAVEWHKVRGSFLVVTMKLVSLAYDVDSPLPLSKKRDTPSPTSPSPPSQLVPNFISYVAYAVFPSTTIFGPFVTYSEHVKYTRRVAINTSWFVYLGRSLLCAIIAFALSSCIFPFLFEDPQWNKWLTAYSSAASFRHSHYFICFLSEASTILSGIGYTIGSSGSVQWAGFRVVYPLDIELPRSLPILVNSWNIPMHLFLKNYVFKPVLVHLNYGGAYFFTFLTSALLHGLNFQLAAVLLTIAAYSYIENRFRYRLSKRLNACVRDRPCPSTCTHSNKSTEWWVALINIYLSLLTIFHLIYLGVMFGGDEQREEVGPMATEGYSMAHILSHWYRLDFLSHYVAAGTLLVSFII